MVGIFANDEAIIRLIGAILEPNDAWTALPARNMSPETIDQRSSGPFFSRPARVS